ncbi:glutamate synthase (ferredoxin) [Breznakia blatticola]|uniref:Glutamate synthase (Ferredoxin) n=1 Tax=Breznakia blatticola TaxID=1754012 RepID=A0A4R7ZHS4_9FIRM|nr:glutamate synthase large subunit [Breznakia blatticola]TDW16626.1 glutamate synthase (ferredoxin) [Breznakia blatticola]
MKQTGLYHEQFEHDNCGIGAVVNVSGEKTYQTIDNALTIVEKLEHRAGMDAKKETGDGVGILTQIPHAYFRDVCTFALPNEDFGVGMFFFPQDTLEFEKAKQLFTVIAKKEGLEILGFRHVDCNPQVLGQKALSLMPTIVQCFIKRPNHIQAGIAFDRKLFVTRKIFEKSCSDTYVCSLSSRTIVYKGMFLVGQLRTFYNDLQHQDFTSAIALVHSRFSTNTMPTWHRAHPNRMIVHNGEINTIKGNANKMLSREENMTSSIFGDDLKRVLPVIDSRGSDSSMLDNALEFMVMAGMDLAHAMMLNIPEPWEHNHLMSQSKKDFYQYNACLMEPWDGPASILFSDGDVMGAVLDRNGLRPSRYYVTKDGYLILSSEVGVLDIEPSNIEVKCRLEPGKMLLVDTNIGRIIQDDELKAYYAQRAPYGKWIEKNLRFLSQVEIPNKTVDRYSHEQLTTLQKVHGYSYEDIKDYIIPAAQSGIEPVIAMGADRALAASDTLYQPLFSYFKQLFAQVTNPPIDAIREEIVTSTSVYLGRDGNIFQDDPKNVRLLKIQNPILSNVDMLKIKHLQEDGFRCMTISMLYYKNTSLKEALDHMCYEADQAIHQGATLLVLSDCGVDENHVAIPSLLATSALNQHLLQTKKSLQASIIVESAEPREVHHFATLLGYGASAINPYLVHDTIADAIANRLLEKDYDAAIEAYDQAMLHGIVKIASKMGISTIQSYQGSQVFEALGIHEDVISTYFTKTISRVGGIRLADIEKQQHYLHAAAFDALGLSVDKNLDSTGMHKYRSQKEMHLYNPKTIHLLQKATRQNEYSLFKQFTKEIEKEMEQTSIRGLLEFKKQTPISIDEVESVEDIVTRFKTGAMSYGSISKEAHETLAIAMNTLHGKSNSGEGGEDASRFHTNRYSAIKQVASGRFGVTSEYLVHAKEIQIKMAQGAKPGEGGQLPAGKVYPWIAKTRHSTPGVQLISPPPHHDIYSIEDLAQLIYDCKSANKDARISVKLVSEAGVGTIAAGVAKAGSEVILISGYDGGTGAAPKNSVYHAGLPWELGLAEAHQTLIMNDLRSRVRLECDGKLLTGKDVAIAALLGAEEFGFATAPLVSLGCVMMRVCHLDTCPVGIATQNPKLRKRFSGKPEYVIHFMRFIAQELREYMAQLGFRSIDEMVGHSELLQVKKDVHTSFDLTRLLTKVENKEKKTIFDPQDVYDFELDTTLDAYLIDRFSKAIDNNESATASVCLDNQTRSFGTMLGSYITKHLHGRTKEHQYRIFAKGAGGQSFGAFLPKGVSIYLEGDSNDYFGKGLSGGSLALFPPKDATFEASENIIVGNVAFYGATSGNAYIAGIAGERFCVRNSGIDAVVEGVGDHGLEYMTGGRVCILGSCGSNLAAGMSGGYAYIFDENADVDTKLNKEMVELQEIVQEQDFVEIKEMLQAHIHYTNSSKAKRIINDFDVCKVHFKKIMPVDYKKMMQAIQNKVESGLSLEDAQMEAFYERKEV